MKLAVVVLSDGGNPHIQAFHEVAEAMHAALQDLGHESVHIQGRPPDRRAIVFGLAAYPNATLRPDTIIYNMEQVGSPWFTPTLIETYRRHTVWDYSAANAARYREYGLPEPRVVPFGWHPCLEMPDNPGGRWTEAERDIDVLHVGSINTRRQQILDELSARGFNVMRLFNVYGAERDRYLMRARVLLNVHYYGSAIFEQARVHSAVAKGRAVVSEHSVAGEGAGLVAAHEYTALVAAVITSVFSPGAREAQEDYALSNFRSMPMTDFLRPALDAL